jgi:hypothetical protein
MHIRIDMHIRMNMRIHMHIRIRIHQYIRMHMHIRIRMHIPVHIPTLSVQYTSLTLPLLSKCMFSTVYRTCKYIYMLILIYTHTNTYIGDRGKITRASGDYCTIIIHDTDKKKTQIRLPSGSRKTVPSECRAMVGLVAGGGRLDKPMLKAGRAYHKYRVKRNCWPKVRSYTHSRIHSYAHQYTHSSIYSPNTLNHLLTNTLAYTLTHLYAHSLTYIFTRSPIHSLTYTLTHVYPFTHLFTHSSTR